MDPKVSIIIPVYNAEEYLCQCLNSILSQSLNDIEIICVDDCSTDGCNDILVSYAANDSRFKVIRNNNNLHAGPSRNRGLEIAKGEYILFMDADDWLVEDSLERLYLDTVCMKADISRCRALEYDNITGEKVKNEFSYLKNVPFYLFNRIIQYSKFPHILTKVNVAPWGGLYKRSFLLQNNIAFDSLSCCNDRAFYCKSIILATRVVFFKTELVNYRTNNKSSLVGSRAKYFYCHFDSFNIIDFLCGNLSLRLRKIYLNGELFDIAHWLEKSLQTEYADEIKLITYQFLQQIDTTPWKGKIDKEQWYKRIMTALER